VRTRIVLPLAAIVLTLVGCGEGDGDETEVGALSRTEFAQEANALCREAAADRRTVLSGVDPEAPGEETAERLDEIVAVDRKLIRDVDDLVPPERVQDTIDQLLDQWRDRVDLEEQVRDATAVDDAAETAQLQVEVQQVDERANQIAGGLLLNECTRGAD
jgi:protein-tyrosine-phosphatase